MERIYVKPAEGRQCRLPDGTLINPEGQKVDLTPFMRRRLADGDVVKAQPASPPSAPPPSAAKATKSKSGTAAGTTTDSEA